MREFQTEVRRFPIGALNVYSPHLSYDPARSIFLITGGNDGSSSTIVNVLSSNFDPISQHRLDGRGIPGEGQAILTNEYGEVVYPFGMLMWAGATVGPARFSYPTKVTGFNIWNMTPASNLDIK